MGALFEAAGPMLANTTFYPVLGNHEGNMSVYHEIFGVLPWYSYECGDARFIVLDSNPMTPAMASDQDRWLNVSMENNSTWNFVFLHHPLFTSEVNHWGGYADLREKWGPLFQTSGVDATFSAHVHAYEHFQVNRTHYFTVATGGAPSYPLSTKKPDGYVYSMENTLGYVRVTVDSQQVSLEFVPVAEVKDGQVVLLPEESVGERVIISKFSSDQETNLLHFFIRSSPVFGKPIRIFT
jgi:acid phosphatase type 7